MKKRKKPLYEIRASGIEGKGAFALRRIRKGQTVDEYTGKHITEEEADALYDDEAEEHNRTYLFFVDDDELIDAAQGGNDARFINHSCEPNCRAVQDGRRIFIEAIQNIQPGAELTYDYEIIRSGRPTAAWRKLYECWCGTPSCRGTMLRPTPAQRRRAAALRRKARAAKPRRRETR